MNKDKGIFEYLQPIINVSAGFMKTDGYMLYMPTGVLVLIDENEMYCGIIEGLDCKIPYTSNIMAKTNSFMSLKNPENQDIDNLYFTGWNIKYNHMLYCYLQYHNIDSKVNCIYDQIDSNVNGFQELVSQSNIQNLNIPIDSLLCRLPVSKSITNRVKGDSVRLQIYDYISQPENNQIKTVKYSLFKKKFGLVINIFTNILMV